MNKLLFRKLRILSLVLLELFGTYQGFPCGVHPRLIKWFIHPHLWRLHHYQGSCFNISNGSRFPYKSNSRQSKFLFDYGFRHRLARFVSFGIRVSSSFRFSYPFTYFVNLEYSYIVKKKKKLCWNSFDHQISYHLVVSIFSSCIHSWIYHIEFFSPTKPPKFIVQNLIVCDSQFSNPKRKKKEVSLWNLEILQNLWTEIPYW